MKYARSWRMAVLLAAVVLGQAVWQGASWGQADSGSDLDRAFTSPPDSAKPHTWWHWMNGNVSKAGITLDLEAMKRVGIGGAHLAQVGTGIPKGPVPYDSPEMVDCVRFAYQEADRLGMDLILFNCPGWSSSGGPWVKPENSMKVLTFTETAVEGGKKVSVALARPAANLGFYRDAFTVAYPTPAAEGKEPHFDNGLGTPRRRPGAAPASAPAVDLPAAEIDPSKVVDVSKFVDAQGKLTWDAPAGKWTVLRIGFTSNGTQNHPAPNGGQGLEVDKFSNEALDAHFNTFFKPYFAVMKPLAAKGKAGALIDSYETGRQNWTDAFPEEFKKRRGYDMTPYMPAMAAGLIVGTPEITARFLWDVRKTQAELMDENYYGHFTELCHEHGMKSFFEPYDTGNFDEMEAGAYADLPMGEFWQFASNQRSIKLVASVMHMNGRRIMGAESFTSQSRWTESPFSLKSLGDFMWTQGLNKFIFHRFAMQPNPNPDVVPGMTMGPWGGHFDRTNTWFEQGKAWLQYVTRSQAMLQAGRFVGDLAYFAGEDSPVRNPNESHLDPAPPSGHGYDTIDTVTLAKRVKIADGKITLPDGMTYRTLVLPPTLRTMTPETLGNVHKLVEAGMTLVVSGPKPEKSPSLTGYPQADASVKQMAADLWGDMNGTTVTEHALGKGRVYWVAGNGANGGLSLESALEEKMGVKKDFSQTSRSGIANINYIHEAAGDSEFYFVANRGQQTEDLVCTFNVHGKQVELWDSASGVQAPARVYEEAQGQTRVALHLAPSGSIFVVFRPGTPALRGLARVTLDGKTVAGLEPFAAAPAGTPVAVAGMVTSGGSPRGQMPVPLPNEDAPPAVDLLADAKGDLLFWQNGRYELQGADGKTSAADITGIDSPREIAGPWHVAFQAHRGAPAEATFDRLISWSDDPDKGVKYFSGTAAYTNHFNVAAPMLAGGKRLFLDLGRVQVLAEVAVNGKDLGILWKLPFRVDVTDALHEGNNDVEIRVTNLWPNRLIGDEQLPAENQYNQGKDGRSAGGIKEMPEWYMEGKPKPAGGRITFTTWHHYNADSPLLESGLIGPVVLREGKLLSADNQGK